MSFFRLVISVIFENKIECYIKLLSYDSEKKLPVKLACLNAICFCKFILHKEFNEVLDHRFAKPGEATVQ